MKAAWLFTYDLYKVPVESLGILCGEARGEELNMYCLFSPWLGKKSEVGFKAIMVCFNSMLGYVIACQKLSCLKKPNQFFVASKLSNIDIDIAIDISVTL